MKIKRFHPWDVSYQEAVEIQERLRPLLTLRGLPRRIRHIAGADVSFSKGSDLVWAGVVVLGYPGLERIEEQWMRGRSGFPYIPGLLSFRELPLLLEAMERLKTEPDIIFCDGQGIAHPRSLGIASHLGLLLDKPTVGCAKTRLIGEFSEVGEEKGSHSYLRYKGRLLGAALRTRRGVKPLFVSQGNKITLSQSMRMVLDCCRRYRIPEPTRQAHLLVNGLRRREAV
jgi:deoxyribonuclease V